MPDGAVSIPNGPDNPPDMVWIMVFEEVSIMLNVLFPLFASYAYVPNLLKAVEVEKGYTPLIIASFMDPVMVFVEVLTINIFELPELLMYAYAPEGENSIPLG